MSLEEAYRRVNSFLGNYSDQIGGKARPIYSVIDNDTGKTTLLTVEDLTELLSTAEHHIHPELRSSDDYFGPS